MQTSTRMLPHVLSSMVFIIMIAGRGCIFHQFLQSECQNPCVSKEPSLGTVFILQPTEGHMLGAVGADIFHGYM